MEANFEHPFRLHKLGLAAVIENKWKFEVSRGAWLNVVSSSYYVGGKCRLREKLEALKGLCTYAFLLRHLLNFHTFHGWAFCAEKLSFLSRYLSLSLSSGLRSIAKRSIRIFAGLHYSSSSNGFRRIRNEGVSPGVCLILGGWKEIRLRLYRPFSIHVRVWRNVNVVRWVLVVTMLHW